MRLGFIVYFAALSAVLLPQTSLALDIGGGGGTYTPSRPLNVSGTLTNFDVWNRTGQNANDFHMTLGGVLQSSLSGPWTGTYPNATISSSSGLVTVSWTGSTTSPGSSAHFGIKAQSPASYIGLNWTLNGTNIGGVPAVLQGWNIVDSGSNVGSLVTNNSDQNLWIAQRANFANVPLTLADLNVGQPLWETAESLNASPSLVLPGGSLSDRFLYQPTALNYVMILDVYEDAGGAPGALLTTYLNAATVTMVPEPQSMGLLLVGVATLCGYHLRRRQRDSVK